MDGSWLKRFDKLVETMDGTVELLDKTGVQVTGIIVIVANMYYYVSYTLCKNILATTLQGHCYYFHFIDVE